jgi:hypothetical protein
MTSPSRPHKSKLPKASDLVARLTKVIAGAQPAAGPWVPMATYPRLLTLDPVAAGLVRQSGVYACWHLGVRPRWLRVGGGADVGVLLQRLQKHDLIAACDAHGGVFVAWALVRPAAIGPAVGSLAVQLSPAFQYLMIEGEVSSGGGDSPFPLPPNTPL